MKVVLHFPSFPTADDALEYITTYFPSADRICLQRGPDGLVRGTAMADAALHLTKPVLPDAVIYLWTEE